MRVLHAPVEVAGQLAIAAEALRRAGVSATAYCEPHRFEYGHGPDVIPAVGHPVRYVTETTRLLARHDVIHFHFATSFFHESRRFFDARLIRRFRRVFVTFHGSEVRRPSVEHARNPHYVPVVGEDDAVAERRLRAWARITDDAVILEPGLRAHVEPFFARVHEHRLTVDVSRHEARPPAGDPPVLVHSPTDHAGKGTAHVRAAVDALRARGLVFEYDEVVGVPQAEALRRYAAADLVVDQLCVGSFGVFAVQAMAMAKPVVAFLGSWWDGYEAPIIRADPTTITDVLAEWLAPGADRRGRGEASRAYVEREHDLGPAGRRLAELYGA